MVASNIIYTRCSRPVSSHLRIPICHARWCSWLSSKLTRVKKKTLLFCNSTIRKELEAHINKKLAAELTTTAVNRPYDSRCSSSVVGRGFVARRGEGTNPPFFFAFNFESFELEVQIKFCLHICVSCDDGFQIRSLLNTF